MKILDFLRHEIENFTLYEKIFFPSVIVFIILLSFITNDNKIALISAICGIGYTILAGKGKISCYFIGIIGTFCYCYISYKNGFYGNLALYGLYFLPMQIIGILKWKNYINIKTHEIAKTKLTSKEVRVYLFFIILFFSILYFFLIKLNGKNPLIDSLTTILSIFGQLLTVKRCIEQWYIWFIVDTLTLIMWIISYINGSNCLATIIMWLTYVFLAIYFLKRWKDEIKNE